MQSNYRGIKYYSATDMSLSYNFEKARELLDNIDSHKVYTSINEIIELYNVNLIVLSPGINTEYSKPYVEKAKKLVPIVARFFSTIDDSNIIKLYNEVSWEYTSDFWVLFEKYRLYERITCSVFESILTDSKTALYMILEHKEIVRYYNESIAIYMKQSDQSARIIVGKYLEKKETQTHDCYLPKSLKPAELEEILDNYIDSDNPNVNILQLIALSQSSAECPLSDKIRLKARKKAKLLWDNNNTTWGLSYGIGICFKESSTTVSYEKTGEFDYQISYDINWIKENLDYPTLWNNFIYLFEYVDKCYRASFVSIESKLSVFEKTLGIKGIKEYEIGTLFRLVDMKSLSELTGYSSVLSEFNIRIEDLIQWFFREYLALEFNVDCFVINMPTKETSLLEKCRIIPSEMDGILKQYDLFVTDHAIDRELFEMSSKQVVVGNIPSLLKNKYAYANSEDIAKEQFLLFSDQCMLSYLPKFQGSKNFLDLITNNNIKLSDYQEWEIPNIRWLENRKDIIIEDDGTIRINWARAFLLRDLYENEVICPHYYKSKEIIDDLVSCGELRYGNTLFSVPEQKYINFMLNKSEYSNGLDLRNKYIHSTYPIDETQQNQDYMRLLRIMILLVLKINEEFCLSNPS